MKTRISIVALLLGAFAVVGPSAGAAGSGSDKMRLTPIGYRLDAAGDIKAYDPSVVTVTPGDTSIVTSNRQVTLTADLNRDYKVIRWQKFDADPTVWTEADPIEEFGEKSETVSVDFNANVDWMYVTVVVEYDPVRTVKASRSSFARGAVTVSPEKTSYQKGDVVTLTAEPAEGYSFVRWSDGNADHVRTLTVSNDMDLTAFIEPDSSRVSFSAGAGARLGVTSKRVSYGFEYGELPVPVRDDLVFIGWADADGRTVTAKTTVDRSSDHTLYAQWEIPPESYTVVFDANGGTGTQIRVSQTFEVGVSQKLRINTFYKPGSVFVGWNQNEGAEEKQYSDEQIVHDLAPAGATLALFAVWRAEKVAYTVHFEKNADDATGEMIDQQFAGGEEKPLSGCNFRRTGWTLLGWSTDQKAVEAAYHDREKVQDLTTQKELTLYAVWTKNPVYYVNYRMMDRDTEPWKHETVEQGKEYALTATNGLERTGYTFSGWLNGKTKATYPAGKKCTAQELAKMVDDGDTIAFVAVWKPITYTVNFCKNDGTGKHYKDTLFEYDKPRMLMKEQDFSENIGERTNYTFHGWCEQPIWDGESALYSNRVDVVNLASEQGAVVDLYAIWKGKPQDVWINDEPVKLEYGSQLEKPADPERTGYAFVGGWKTNEVPVTFPITVTGSFELKSEDKWTTNEYTVAFHGTDADGGTMEPQAFTYDVAEALTPNVFTRTGYTFANWTNEVGTAFADGAQVKNLATNDGAVVDLYATWTMNPRYYAVRFNPNDGAGEVYVQAIKCGVETALTPKRFARTGYGFANWTNATGTAYADGEKVTDLAAEGETNDLYAVWSANRYGVKFEPNGADGGSMAAQAFTYDVAQALMSNAFTKTGYSFDGWKTNETGSAVFADGAVVSNLTAEADATNTLWATWAPNKYTVVIDGVPTEMDYDSDIAEPADPAARDGYTFTGWTTNGAPVAAWPLKVPLGGLTISSAWTANAYTVEFRGPGEAYTQGFTYDVSQALTANRFTPPELMVFDCWTNAVDSTTYANGEVVSNLTTDGVFALYATWKDAPSYTVAFDGNGADGGSMANLRFECGKGGTLPANGFARTGYAFDQWTNKVNGATYADGATFAEDLAPTNGTANLSALWTANRYWVKFEPNGGAGEMEAQAFAYDEAQALTANAFTRTGYGFAGWADGEDAVATKYTDGAVVSNLTAEADATNTLWATWTPNKYTVVIDGVPTEMDYGSDIAEPADPAARDGYAFTGWTTNGVPVAAWPLKVPLGGLEILSAWMANAYTVEFRGPGEAYTQNFTYDEPQALEANRFPEPEWKVFDCWTNAVNSTTYADGAVVSNLTTGGVFALYATWKDAPSYTVAFDRNGADGGSMLDRRFECGKGGKLPANAFTRTGYAFDQWTNRVNGATFADGATFAEDLAPTNGTATLSALWTPNRFWVKFEPNGADGGENMAVQEFTYDVAQALTSNAFTRTGYGFAGWADGEDAVATKYTDGAVVSNLTAEADATNTLWATWTPNKYTVLIDGVPTEMDYGSDIAEPADPAARDGYAFTGWTTNGVPVAAWPLKVPLGGLEILSAWMANAYTVRFNRGEGTGEMGDQSFTYDVPQNLAANAFTAPERKVFDCWTNVAGDAYADCALVTNLVAEGVCDLYAVWTDAPSYTVRFNANGGAGAPYVQDIECGVETALTPNRFARTGYGFAGWDVTAPRSEGAAGTVVYTNGEKVTDLAAEGETNDLYAVWTANRFWVRFDGNGADGGEAMAVQEFTYDVAQALTSNAFTRTGYGFAGWDVTAPATRGASGTVEYADGAVVSNLTAEADATNTLWATWAPNKYTVVYHGPDGATSDQPFTYDKEQKLKGADTFDPPELMVFAGWTNAVGKAYAAESTVSNLTAEAGGSVNLYAAWGDDSYTVTFDGNDATGGEMEPQIFKHGDKGPLTPNAFTRTGHGFAGWADGEDAVATKYVDGADFTAPATGIGETLHAVWTNCLYKCSFDDGDYKLTRKYGDKISLPENYPDPREGQTFMGWTTNGTDIVNLETFTMPNHDVAFTSKWEAITYTIAFDGNDATSGAMAATNVKYDVEIALPSNTYMRTGYEFGHWTNSDGRVFNDGAKVKNLSVTDGATVTLYAVWQETGNPLSIALGLGPNFDVKVSETGAWTVIGEPKGLSRTSSSPAGTLRVTVPSGGTLHIELDVDSIGGPLSVKFEGEEIEPLNDDAQRDYGPESGGTFEFSGTPASGTTWTLRNFTWTAK